MKDLFLILLLLPGLCLAQDLLYGAQPYPTNGKTIVHLFEWKWPIIASECENFLGPMGYAGIQVSPVSEHILGSQWWTRYQPVSYILESRSGTRAEFINMVERCNDVGVYIYVDIVINHMTGSGGNTGWAGSSYDYDAYSYPAVPYSTPDFHVTGCEIDYGNAASVRDCPLLGMRDLDQTNPWVQDKVEEFLDDLIGIGVAGFRVDAAKHMWPGDIEYIYSLVDNLNIRWFQAGTPPYIFQEVIDQGGEAISAGEYASLARVTEFKYSRDVSAAFMRDNNLHSLIDMESNNGHLSGIAAVAFVDNHDNQRDHGGGGNIATYKTPYEYKAATGFSQAWNYADKRIMSSYVFNDKDQGPPDTDPAFNPDGSCQYDTVANTGWVCEHRWRQIYNMVKFRQVVENTGVENVYTNFNNEIAFSRGNMGFIAFNYESTNMNQFLQTGMPAGTYCDVISGDLIDGVCTGRTITVDASGSAQIDIPTSNEDAFIAIHVGKSL